MEASWIMPVTVGLVVLIALAWVALGERKRR
jgi:hypothetical protein